MTSFPRIPTLLLIGILGWAGCERTTPNATSGQVVSGSVDSAVPGEGLTAAIV